MEETAREMKRDRATNGCAWYVVMQEWAYLSGGRERSLHELEPFPVKGEKLVGPASLRDVLKGEQGEGL